MKLIAIFIILLTLPAYAAKHVLPQPPEGDGSGRETSTNAVVLVDAVDAGRFGLCLELNAETNNNVTVEFGVNGTARIKKFGLVFECDTNRYCTVWREE